MTDDRIDVSASYGVIGVGSLAEAIVTGLCEGRTDAPSILLSPRGQERSTRLARRFHSVDVAEDNQAAAAGARTVLLCVRPQEAAEVLGSIDLRPEQHVVSVMAALTLPELERLCAPATSVSRAIPSMTVATRDGVTPVFPAGSAADALFDGLGGSMVLADEELLAAVSAASATVASHFSYLRTVSGWLAARGVDQNLADRYIASIFAGVGSELVGVSDLAPLAAAHATRGGLNERNEQALRDRGVFATVEQVLDEIHGSLLRRES